MVLVNYERKLVKRFILSSFIMFGAFVMNPMLLVTILYFYFILYLIKQKEIESEKEEIK